MKENIEFDYIEKPDNWPANAREHKLEIIEKALEDYINNPGYLHYMRSTIFQEVRFPPTGIVIP